MKLRASIERDLPALVIGLLAAVVLAMAILTYREIGRFAESAASTRLLERSKTCADLFSLELPQRLGQLRAAAEGPLLRAALETGDAESRARALEAMKRLTLHTTVAVELRDALDRVVLSTAAESAEHLPEQPRHVAFGPLYAGAEGGVYYDLRTPVMAGAEALGALVERRRALADDQGRQALQGLLGAEAELLLGNATGELWTDLRGIAEGPPAEVIERMRESSSEYARGGIGRFGAVADVAGTPWAVLVEMPRAAVYQPVRPSRFRVGLIAWGTLVLGAASAWILSRRLTAPLAELSEVVGAIAAGDLGRRVHVIREDELGKLAGTFNVMADRIAHARLDLESKVEDRTRALREANAELAQKELERKDLHERLRELDRLKTEFFANVSHELRTPLALILGPIEKCLSASELPRAQRRNLEIAQQNARLLLEDVGDLLDVAKLDVGRMALRYAEVDLAALVRRTASHFGPLADERASTFDVEAPATLRVQVDPDKVQRVLVNLISNAFEFTPSGGRVRCSLASEDRVARLIVSDNGPGIPEHLREAVFDRFFQVEERALFPAIGTGLGLSIVKEFVSLHGGSIRVEETPGGGAQFTVEIPLHAAPGVFVDPTVVVPGDELARDAAMALRSRGEAAPPVETAGAPVVLVVEDNPEMNAFVAETLAGGSRVSTALDGLEGLEKAIALRPDLIVCDLMLPKLGGDQFVDEVRRRHEMDSVPILLLTARADEEIRADLLNRGAQDCLVKPFHPGELQARATGLIARKRRSEERVREQQRLLLAVTEGLSEGVFVKDRLGRYIMANSAAARIFGRDVAEFIGKTDKELRSAGWEDADQKYDREAILRGESQTYEISLGTGSAQRTYLVTMGPYRDEQVVIGTTGILRDITFIKQAESSLRQANDALLRSNEDLNQFTYAASHDLQEPLRMVSTFTQLLHDKCRGRIDNEVDEFLVIIVESATRMSAMLRDILSYSKATMLSDLPDRPVEVSFALSKAILNLELAATEAGATITHDQLPAILVHESHLVQILQNLIGNSIKYRSTEPPVIHVSAERREQEWVFSVTDNGIGIDPRFSDQIFGLFRRLHGRKYAGTGIGLATCDRIVKRYGGRIWVDSEPGKGSTFRFSFPSSG